MSFIRTVLGDVAPEKLGPCYAHEHLIIEASYATEHEPDFLINNLEKAFLELRALRAVGVRALVDSMPCACGRNIRKLANLAAETAMHVLAPTGIHLAKYYPPVHWSNTASVDHLVDLFVADIEEGIDFHDYSDETIRRSSHKAGLIKVAALTEWDVRTKNIFVAAAQAQKKTGAPILTHTENGQLALEQAQFLIDQGADPQHIVLSHLDRNQDSNYHREVLRTGVTIEYDSHFRAKDPDNNPTLKLLRELLPEFPHQIVLGMDAARRSYWTSYGGSPGLPWLYTTFRDEIMKTIPEQIVDFVFLTTPARVYAFMDGKMA